MHALGQQHPSPSHCPPSLSHPGLCVLTHLRLRYQNALHEPELRHPVPLYHSSGELGKNQCNLKSLLKSHYLNISYHYPYIVKECHHFNPLQWIWIIFVSDIRSTHLYIHKTTANYHYLTNEFAGCIDFCVLQFYMWITYVIKIYTYLGKSRQTNIYVKNMMCSSNIKPMQVIVCNCDCVIPSRWHLDFVAAMSYNYDIL